MDLKDILGGLLGGAGTALVLSREHGGSVKKGKAYLVGEDGKELFLPSENGEIISNDELKKASKNDKTKKENKNALIVINKMDKLFDEDADGMNEGKGKLGLKKRLKESKNVLNRLNFKF